MKNTKGINVLEKIDLNNKIKGFVVEKPGVVGEVIKLAGKLHDDELEAKDLMKSGLKIAAVEAVAPIAVSTTVSALSSTALAAAVPFAVAAAPFVVVGGIAAGIGLLLDSIFD